MDDQKFLILRLSAVGDVIRTLPAVKTLKEYFPSSTITWIVEEPSRSFLESQHEIDEVILFPRKRWTRGMTSLTQVWGTIGEMRGFIRGLRKRKFDTVLDFHGILKSGVLSFLSGAPRRIGYDRKSTKEGNFLFSNVKVGLPKERISRFKRNLALLRGVALEAKELKCGLYIPPEDREYVALFYKASSASIRRPLIAIHPGTSTKAVFKRWMPDQYARVADQLIEGLQATVLFTWGDGELAWVDRIRKQMKNPSLLGPKTESLTQLGEVYRHCDLYIGGDTGPMHVASLMGIPAVVIYGPTDPVENEPIGDHIKVRKEVGCNPCHEYSCKELSCIKTISADDVFEATKKILRPTR
ncbi:MAG TPA: glycosyltransferase family 9 protein [Thermodesulfobacteriota bacterium]|nr:glycosyltransferase family 9 protein [Thermodesulfobacteriota bacterium]